MGLDPVEFACLDQGRDDGPVLCASIMSRKERVFAVESDGSDGALDGIVVEFDTSVVEEQDQPVPILGDVFQSLTGRGFGRDAGTTLGEPSIEGFDDRF